MHLFEQIIAAIAPHECIACGAQGAVLCADCAAALPASPGRCYRCGKLDAHGRTCRSCRRSSPLYAVTVVTMYDGAAKAVVHRMKFEGARTAAQDVARAMASKFETYGDSSKDATEVLNAAGAASMKRKKPLLITHVPTANRRVRQRGYDQAELMARQLSRELYVPHAALLARLGTARQVGTSGPQRREQLRSAFRPLKPTLIQNADVLLVDDVLTTGSTLEAAAAVLRAGGARRVSAIVFAQA